MLRCRSSAHPTAALRKKIGSSHMRRTAGDQNRTRKSTRGGTSSCGSAAGPGPFRRSHLSRSLSAGEHRRTRVARKAELSHQTLLPHGSARKVNGICNSVLSCSKQEKWTTSLWMVHGNCIPPAEGKRYSNALDEPAAWFSISILELFTSPIQPPPIRSAARDRQIYVRKIRHTLVTARRPVLLRRATSSGGGQTRTCLMERWAEESVVSATCVFPHGTHTTTQARPTQQGGWKPQVNQATPVNKLDCSARLDHLHSSCCPLSPP